MDPLDLPRPPTDWFCARIANPMPRRTFPSTPARMSPGSSSRSLGPPRWPRPRSPNASPARGLETESRALALVIETADGLDSLEGSRVIGDIAIWLADDSEEKAEVGWILDPAAAGHGFATEAAIAVLNLAFDHYGLHRVFAQMDARNTASAKLAQRIGMRQEAHLRRDWWSKGEWTDTLVFGMLSSDRQTA